MTAEMPTGGGRFAAWLSAELARRRMSLGGLAQRTGIASTSLSGYARGVRLPQEANLVDLLDFFGADHAEIRRMVAADESDLARARAEAQAERIRRRGGPAEQHEPEPTLHIGFSAKSTVPADLVSLIETAVKKAVAEAQAEGVNVATPDRPVRVLREGDGATPPPAPWDLFNVYETHARASAGEGHEAWDCWPVPLPERVTATNVGLYVVDGDCLSPHVQPGDRLVVDGDASPRDGQVVVVTLGRLVNAKWFKAADDDGDDRLLDNTGRVLRLDDDDVHYRGVVLSVVRPPPERPSA